MLAVILERNGNGLKYFFGADTFEEIPFFDTTLGMFLKQKRALLPFDKTYSISFEADSSSVLCELKTELKNKPSDNVFMTYSDVCFGDDFSNLLVDIEKNTVIKTAENEILACVLKSKTLIEGLRKTECDVRALFDLAEEKIICKSGALVVDKPLKYKGLCFDVLSGNISYRLPELAQGIYTCKSIPNGDFVLIPPVFLGENVQIEKGCVIGPNAIISDSVLVAENSSIRNSFLGEDAYVSKDCYVEGAMISRNVVLRRNSVVFDASVLCHDAMVGEDAVVEKGGFLRAFSKVDDGRKSFFEYKKDDVSSTEGFYGFSPERAALLGASVGVCFEKPRIAVASDGEMNSTALKLALLSGLLTTGAACFDFGNAFFSALHYYMDFCELDCAAFVSGNDEGTVISVFKKGESSLSKSDFYNIKSVFSSGFIQRCSKDECKSIRQIHGMQRMYVQHLASMFDESLDFLPGFYCDNKRILSITELAVSKIGFKSIEKRVKFNINGWGTTVCAQSEGVVYPYTKLLELVSFFLRKNIGLIIDDTYRYDAITLCFYILKILSVEKRSLKETIEDLPRFYVAQRNVDNRCELKVIAADLSQNNRIDFRKDEINYNDGLNTVRINEVRKGLLSVKAKAASMEAATEIVENIARIISGHSEGNY